MKARHPLEQLVGGERKIESEGKEFRNLEISLWVVLRRAKGVLCEYRWEREYKRVLLVGNFRERNEMGSQLRLKKEIWRFVYTVNF